MLADLLKQYDLKDIIKPVKEFHPFPVWKDRDGWSCITQETRKAWLTVAEKYKDFQWPTITADKYLSFHKTGNNLHYLMQFYERRSALGILVIAECIEGKGRFLEQIINGIVCICEETSWMTPFDSSLRNVILPFPEDRIVDLSCSETGALLTWTCYLLKENLDQVTPRICERIKREIDNRLIVPYMERDDYWWMGFVETNRVNNWNPWCNRNMLMCFLILDIDSKTRIDGIHKIMRSLDQYLLKYPADGCCDEGPMYWGAAGGGLHTCLKLLQIASSGRIDIFQNTMVKMIGQYIYKVHIHENYFVDFADGDAIVEMNPSVYDYGLSIGDKNLIGLGAYAVPKGPTVFSWFGVYEYLLDMYQERDRAKSKARTPYVRDAWMDQTHVMTARESQGSEDGFFLAAKGGNNSESHNHNDVGNFIVYVDGKPLIIDLGTEEYTAKTFSKERFELWYLQSQYHNCPTIHGVMQKDGKSYRAKNVDCRIKDTCTEMTMDISEAYPQEAGIDSWNRTIRLVRADKVSVEVIDDFRLTNPSSDTFYSLMTPCEPIVISGEIKLAYSEGKAAFLQYDEANLSVIIDTIQLTESRLNRNWGDKMYRIVLKEKSAVQKGIRKISIHS